MSKLRCPDCGTVFPATESQCPECGCPANAAMVVPGSDSNQHYCSECGCPLPDGCTSCPDCGAPVDAPRVCEACGSIIPDGASVCPNCGCPVSKVKKAPVQKPPQPKPTATFTDGTTVGQSVDDEYGGSSNGVKVVFFLVTIFMLLVIGFIVHNTLKGQNYDNDATVAAVDSDSVAMADTVVADTPPVVVAHTPDTVYVNDEPLEEDNENADDNGFKTASDVFSYLYGMNFYCPDNSVTLKVSRDGVYGNDNLIGHNPSIRSITSYSAIIVAGRVRLYFNREDNTLTDLSDNSVYRYN